MNTATITPCRPCGRPAANAGPAGIRPSATSLIARQRPDGSWHSAYGSEYATAMCLIILQMPENQLPIFQR